MPVTGIYRVEHESHRLMHMATLLCDDVFPQCKRCGPQVRFTMVRPVGEALPFRPTQHLDHFSEKRAESGLRNRSRRTGDAHLKNRKKAQLLRKRA